MLGPLEFGYWTLLVPFHIFQINGFLHQRIPLSMSSMMILWVLNDSLMQSNKRFFTRNVNTTPVVIFIVIVILWYCVPHRLWTLHKEQTLIELKTMQSICQNLVFTFNIYNQLNNLIPGIYRSLFHISQYECISTIIHYKIVNILTFSKIVSICFLKGWLYLIFSETFLIS